MIEEKDVIFPSPDPTIESLEAAQREVNDAIHRKRAADLAVTGAQQAADQLVAEARAQLQEAEDAVTAALRKQNDIQDVLMGRSAKAPRAPRAPRQPRDPAASNGRGAGRAPRMRRPANPPNQDA